MQSISILVYINILQKTAISFGYNYIFKFDLPIMGYLSWFVTQIDPWFNKHQSKYNKPN